MFAEWWWGTRCKAGCWAGGGVEKAPLSQLQWGRLSAPAACTLLLRSTGPRPLTPPPPSIPVPLPSPRIQAGTAGAREKWGSPILLCTDSWKTMEGDELEGKLGDCFTARGDGGQDSPFLRIPWPLFGVQRLEDVGWQSQARSAVARLGGG